jgi:hypothetical protein
MAKTLLSDIIIPDVFEGYAIERTAELCKFVESGIVAITPEFNRLAAGGGQTVGMPFWQDLTAARQILDDSNPLSVNKITAAKDIARIHNDAQVWSVNHLAIVDSGGDPVGVILQMVAAYWARQDEKTIISCLKGMFGAASMATNLLPIGAEKITDQTDSTRLNGSTFVDACALLGDCSDRLTAVAMHSATEAALRKQDLIDFVPDSEGKAMLRTFQQRKVIVDDTLPVRAGTTDGYVWTSYLFGEGAFAKGASPLTGEPLLGGSGTAGVEFERDGLASDTRLINRRRYLLHPRGVKFTSHECAGESPTDVELEDDGNWERVYEAKNVRIVAVEHNN